MAENLSKERIVREARAEVEKEMTSSLKDEMKVKLRELASAQKLVGNIEREIKEIELKIDHELGSVD